MEHLVEFPATREAPEHVVGGLRALDPLAEVVWWGPREFLAQLPRGGGMTKVVKPCWIIGTVLPSDVGRAMWGRRLWRLERGGSRADPHRGDALRMSVLRYRGFRPALFWPHGDIDSAAVLEFQLMCWLDEHYRKEEIARRERETGGDALEERQRRITEAVSLEMKDIWRYVWAGRRSVLVN